MASPDVSAHSLTNTSSTTSLSPSIANLNALSSPKSAAQNVHVQQRRMTTSAVPPPSSLNLPEPVYGHPAHPSSSPRRSPSPLRHDFSQACQSDDESDDHDDDENEDANRTRVRGHSPASASVTQFATNLAQRVGSLMSPASGNRALPSDAELEAEALRERDRSRREAERILTREAEERRAVEQRVLTMMNSSPQSLPHPRGRSQTLPSSPSPAASAKEGGTSWWAAAKSRLTPTKEKEPLTPAQQIVQEAKARDKEKKNIKGKDKDWPASVTSKYIDPAYLNLKIPGGGPAPRTSSPTSPTPNRTPVRLSPVPVTQPPINLSPISLQRGSSPAGSPVREQPPLYASFTPSGTLDVPGTLLVIAKRFEKLERWTVSHVRALEERMGDVERWLVDKENERAKEKGKEQEIRYPDSYMTAIRDDVIELQSRVGELGREMARFATSPAVLSTTTAAHDSPVFSNARHTESSVVSVRESSFNTISSTSSVTTSIGTPVMGVSVLSTPRRVPSMTARESTSPPLARVGSLKTPSKGGTRLPYPTGDYASPSDLISPTHTPASSPPVSSRPTSKIVSSLPPIPSPLELPASLSPPARTMSPTPTGLPAPSVQSARRGSVSPTPISGGRKRYTVALGGPIVAPSDAEAEFERETAMGTAYFSSTTESSDEDEDSRAETVGKKAASRAAAAIKLNGGDGSTPASSPGTRARAQSTHGGIGAMGDLQSNQAVPKHRFRSQSTDFRSDNAFGNAPQPNKFVDPLVLRRQSKSEKDNKPLVGPGKKVPVGQLVAFFDSERN
ncbi:hypothetical protein F5I97DRAFT_1901910 [Phlebopus sp. FC_14]|nr:hypothetical protein F5I97DRAFT_1901910 [Phlebopus sp. FC_14]